MKEVKQSGFPSPEIVNRKMTRSFAVPDSFFLGVKVARKFNNKWFLGTVDELEVDEGTKLWHVAYEDFDGEDLSRGELAAAVLYHPLLNTEGDLEVPEVGTFVWFSQKNLPRLGQVTSIDPTVSRPVSVQLYEPRKEDAAIHLARFRPARDDESTGPVLAKITLHQILLRFKALTTRGFLCSKDREKLRRALSR